MRYQHVYDSPMGPLQLFAEADAYCGLYFENHHPAPRQAHAQPNPHAFDALIQQLDEFFAGRRLEFDLPLTTSGTEFQKEVWSILQRIPYGQTWTYGTIAQTCGRPQAVRAVGAAVGRNPISILIPCHRVVGAGGKLTGFAGGIERKRCLLDLESNQPQPS